MERRITQAKDNYAESLPELVGEDPIMMKMRLVRYTMSMSGLPPKPLLTFTGSDYTYQSNDPMGKTAWLCPLSRADFALEFYDVTRLQSVHDNSISDLTELIVYKSIAKTSSLVNGEMTSVDEVAIANVVDMDIDTNIQRMGYVLLKLHTMCAACKSLRIKHLHVPAELIQSALFKEDVIAGILVASAWSNDIESLVIHGYDKSKEACVAALEKADNPLDLLNFTTESYEYLGDVYKNLEQEVQTIRFMDAVRKDNIAQAKSILKDMTFDPSHNNSWLLRQIVSEDKAAFVDLLVEDGRSDPNVTPEFSSSAVGIALKYGNVDTIKALLRDPKTVLIDIDAFTTAVDRESIDIIRMLMDDPRSDPSENDNEAILNAATYGDVEIVKMLLEDKRVNLSTATKEEIPKHTDNEEILGLFV